MKKIPTNWKKWNYIQEMTNRQNVEYKDSEINGKVIKEKKKSLRAWG